MNTRLIGAALAVALGALLSACGDSAGDSGAGDVASLASGAPPKAITASAAAEERPLIRTDTSAADEQRMWDAWQVCLEKNGMPSKGQLVANARAMKANTDKSLDSNAKKAEAACAAKEPERVWERAKRLDPKYADKLRDWVTCIRSHGIDAWENDGDVAFESLPPDDQMKKVNECQDKAFGAA